MRQIVITFWRNRTSLGSDGAAGYAAAGFYRAIQVLHRAGDGRSSLFFRFFKWSAAAELLALREQGGMPLLDWSYPLLVATLIQAFVASILLILVSGCHISGPPCLPSAPVTAVLSRHRPGLHVHGDRLHPEICAFSFSPVICGGVVLCAFLVFAAAGAGSPGDGREKRRQAAMWPLGRGPSRPCRCSISSCCPAYFKHLMPSAECGKNSDFCLP